MFFHIVINGVFNLGKVWWYFFSDGFPDILCRFFYGLKVFKPIIRVSVIFAVTGSLKTYDLVRILTEGGPFQTTEVPSTLLENMLFLRNRYGMGSTISVMLILLCFAFALAITAIFREKDE